MGWPVRGAGWGAAAHLQGSHVRGCVHGRERGQSPDRVQAAQLRRGQSRRAACRRPRCPPRRSPSCGSTPSWTGPTTTSGASCRCAPLGRRPAEQQTCRWTCRRCAQHACAHVPALLPACPRSWPRRPTARSTTRGTPAWAQVRGGQCWRQHRFVGRRWREAWQLQPLLTRLQPQAPLPASPGTLTRLLPRLALPWPARLTSFQSTTRSPTPRCGSRTAPTRPRTCCPTRGWSGRGGSPRWSARCGLAGLLSGGPWDGGGKCTAQTCGGLQRACCTDAQGASPPSRTRRRGAGQRGGQGGAHRRAADHRR